MSNFRAYRGGYDRGGSGGHHYRTGNIKAAPPPPVGIGSGSRRSPDRHYDDRHRSRSPIHSRRDAIPREPPAPQHQQLVSSARTSRHDERSQHASSSRHQDHPPVPPPVPNHYEDHSSSRDTSSRHAEPAKRPPASSSKRTPSPPNSTRKPASSSISKSSKSKTSHSSHSQSTSAGPGRSSKSSRLSAPDAILHSSSRVAITKGTEVLIVREILNPNEVKIPRRSGEGARPIFDRDELRESIQRRIKGGDNEQNPAVEAIEQRVVTIIREPVFDSYADAATASTSSSRKHSSQTESRHRGYSPDIVHTTTSGVPYRLNVVSPPPLAQYASRRSLSPVRPPAERERGRFETDRKRDYRGHDHLNAASFAGESSRSAVNHSRRDRSRSRSRSPSDRVRRVTLNSSSAASLDYANRVSGDRDLRESLSSRALKPELPVSREVDVRSSIRGRGLSRGGYFRRPRGGFSSRGRVFARHVEPRWQHDKFDRSGGDSENQI